MFNSGTKRCLTAHETFDLVSYIVIGFVLPAGDAEKLSQALVLERLETSLASVEEEYIYMANDLYIYKLQMINKYQGNVNVFSFLGSWVNFL